jgi:hypothetical protein
MIKHVVMFKFSERADGKSKAENVDLAINMLKELPEKIREINEYEIGKSFIASERASDLVLISTFDSQKELDKYKIHHEHVKVVDFFK